MINSKLHTRIIRFFLLVFLSVSVIGEATAQQCIVDPPTHLFITDITSCSATLHWDPSTGAVLYQVKYRITSSGAWSPKVNIGLDTFYNFTGLQSAKDYEFAVTAKCMDGSKSQLKKKHAITKVCSLPLSSTATVINPGTAEINVVLSCPADTIHYRYAPLGENWTTSFIINGTSIQLSNLKPGAAYVYQVSSCPLNQNNWTPVDTFTLPRPNFLIIVLDDSRYDSYSLTGGPSWFLTPQINSIAQEGINFKNSFVVFSHCSPSRGTIITGLYPHKNGAVDNTHTIHSYLPNLGTILDGAGYYTGMIGKYLINEQQPGYDYWLDAWPDYVNAKYNANGTIKIIPGHNTDILTDSALKFISNAQQPFYLWLAYHAPHDPAIPQAAFEGIYADEDMPVPDNTEPYSINYPSFLDHLGFESYIDPGEIPSAYENYYETLGGIDPAVGSVLAKLESLNILDNTMVIFTSDNGHLIGEHGIFAKKLAYDPSIRVPLFIRYPLWFNANTVVPKQVALNIDIAPTIIQAAGIEDTFHFDGKSLKKLAEGTFKRKDMMYEYMTDVPNSPGDWPFIRAVRSNTNKYILYGCDADTVEEFFDLVNDPDENVNLINNAAYSALIQTYRNRLTALKQQFSDTAPELYLSCFVENEQQKLSGKSEETDWNVYPNPSDGIINLTPVYMNQTVRVMTLLGVEVAEKTITGSDEKLDLKFLPAGIYYLVYETGTETKMKKIVIE